MRQYAIAETYNLAIQESDHMRAFMKSLSVFAVIGISFALACGQTLRKPEEYLGRGYSRLEHDDLAGALADFNKAIELLPKYAAAYSARAAVKKKMGDTEGALADLSRSIELTPDVAIPYYTRAFILLERKDFDGAIKDFDKALEIQPNLAIVYRNRADAKRARGQTGDAAAAIADYGKVIEIEPQNPDVYFVYFERGALRQTQSDLDGALADYSKAIEINSEYADAYAERGLILLAKGLDKDADKDFARYLELNKDGKDYLEQRIKYVKYQRDKKRKP
jgi:tetratricopeptide (TPR) repeat protein